jgi:hypothetical protein
VLLCAHESVDAACHAAGHCHCSAIHTSQRLLGIEALPNGIQAISNALIKVMLVLLGKTARLPLALSLAALRTIFGTF